MGGMISYQRVGGASHGYLSEPAHGSTRAVVLMHEWWGLVSHLTGLADRLAGAGFVTLVPDLYRGSRASSKDEANHLMSALDMREVAADITGAVDTVAQRTGADKVAVVGFSMGGSFALWAGTLCDKVTATVAFYPPAPWERMQPTWSAYTGKSALVHCAEADGGSTAEPVNTARIAIEGAGGSFIAHGYPGTRHAFFNDDRPEVFDRFAAAQAWARTLGFLRDRL